MEKELSVSLDTEVLDTETVTPEETVQVSVNEVCLKLERLHTDMLFLMFLLLVFWSYQQIKLGFRNLGKFSK